MNFKDYYKDLGIKKTASAAEIKKAYRALAKKYHPDKTNGNRSAEEQFKAISEANEVLSDPVKRKKYDRFGVDWKHYEQAGAQPGGFDWSKYANENAGQTRGPSARGSSGNFGEPSEADLFEMLFGQQSGPGRRSGGVVMKGEDFETETTLTLEEAYHGTTRLIQLDGQRISVTIKPGIAHRQRLRLMGKGGAGTNAASNGDLYLTVLLAQHSTFRRELNDLYANLPVELYTAILGGKSPAVAVSGKTAAVNIPKGTPNGKAFRLRGLGMPVYGKKNEFGDMLVDVCVVLPEHLSDGDIALFKTLAANRSSAGPGAASTTSHQGHTH